MVNVEFEKQEILRKHQKVYGGGNKIDMGGNKKFPKKVTAALMLDNPEILRKSKNSFPFEGEILDAPDMPDIVKELTDTTLKVNKKEKSTEKKLEEIVEKPKAEKTKKFYTKEELKGMDFKKLKVIGKKLGTTDRSKKNIIKEILELQ